MEKKVYQPTWESLNEHKLPEWFMDAKLGIFIHWGVYSVPAWAPRYSDKKAYYNERVGYHPYAELYGYGMLYKESPVWEYHVKKYGAAFQYEDFIPQFTAEKWQPAEWAKLFKEVGAKYVVLVTKHSDGYCMWPTKTTHLNAAASGPKRDITGEMTDAVKAEGMKMGLYHSVTFNWYHYNFPHLPYREMTHAQIKELVDNYQPSLIWSDDYWKPSEKSMAATWKSKDMISYIYNNSENPDEVLVNDRWGVEEDGRQLGDYSTPEYAKMKEAPDFYWEMTRGIGVSYGYHQDDQYASSEELIHTFIDVVSKNGNMLLNVGPKADGTLDETQVARLKDIGAFLQTNGEAMYSTRTWVESEGQTADGKEVRFTTKEGNVYATVLGQSQGWVSLTRLQAKPDTKVTLLGTDVELEWAQDDTGLHVQLPDSLPNPHAYSLRITPEPYRLVEKKKNTHEDKYGEIFRRTGYLKVDI